MRILFLISFLILNSFAANPFPLSKLQSTIDLITYMEFVEDKENRLDPQAVLSSTSLKQLQKSNLGIKPYPVWTTLEIFNDTDKEQSPILYNARPGMDKLDVTVIRQNQEQQTYHVGDARPMENRPIHHRHSMVQFKLSAHETVKIITRCENIGPLAIGWEAMNSDTLFTESIQESMILGAFGGLMFALIIYNLVMYINLKDIAFLVYVFYGITTFSYQYLTAGVWYEWQIIDENLLNLFLYPVGYGFITLMILFNVVFFNTRLTFPKIYRLTLALAGIGTLLIIANFLLFNTPLFHLYSMIGDIFMLLSLILLLIIGLYFIVKKQYGSLYYSLGQGSLIALIVYQLITMVGWLQTNLIVMNAIMIGVFVDMIFLSVALNHKVKIIKEEKERNDKIILLTSRFASMGQVIGNITHQWKVPLVRLGSLMMEVEALLWSSANTLKEDISAIIPKMRETLSFMDETIKEFGEFYKSDSDKLSFNIKKQIDDVKDLLMAKSITLDALIEIDESCELEYFGYKNAFAQVVMIIIDNGLDVAKRRKIKNPKIKLYTLDSKERLTLCIEDNCGGITQSPTNAIFELFESTETLSGSGMGLAIAQKMVQSKMEGEISAENSIHGAKFTIKL